MVNGLIRSGRARKRAKKGAKKREEKRRREPRSIAGRRCDRNPLCFFDRFLRVNLVNRIPIPGRSLHVNVEQKEPICRAITSSSLRLSLLG